MTQLLSEKEEERFRAHQLLSKGRSEKTVANILKKDVKWVRRQERRFEELGNFKDKPRSGQPKKLDSRDTARLVKQVKGKECKSTRKMASSFKTKDKRSVGRETIRKALKTSGLYPHKKRKVTLLTDRQKKKRVEFAKNIFIMIGPILPFGMKLNLS
jgi:transposase